MMTPRRYRVGLRCYPRAYRRWRGDEILDTLAAGDRDRGRPSTREALMLGVAGARLHARTTGSPLSAACGAVCGLCAACAPATLWSLGTVAHGGHSAPVPGGPAFVTRVLVAVMASLVLADLCRGMARRLFAMFAVVLPIGIFLARNAHAAVPAAAATVSSYEFIAAAFASLLTAGLLLTTSSIGGRVRSALLCTGLMAAAIAAVWTAITIPDSLAQPWSWGPAKAAALVGLVLTALSAIASVAGREPPPYTPDDPAHPQVRT